VYVPYTLKTLKFIKNLIRHYGILASRVKSKFKVIADKLLATPAVIEKSKKWRERQATFKGTDPLLCKICQRTMRFVSAYLPHPLALIRKSLQMAFP
jgi:hypothetical protein